MPDERSNYEKGVSDGITEQRLNEYGQHLMKINGSTADTARALIEIKEAFNAAMNDIHLALQSLRDEAQASRETVKTTAQAVEKARLQAKEEAERRWTPIQRALAIVGGLVGLTVLWYFFGGR